MAVAMYMHWPGVTSDQYDAIMARLGLDANPPAGGVLHVATVTDEGVEVCDIWQTEQAFNGFLEQRLLPVVSEDRSGLSSGRGSELGWLIARGGAAVGRASILFKGRAWGSAAWR
jgi:hypothetical protein